MGALRKSLPKPAFKMRVCMNPECKKRFLSDHVGVRFCNKCRGNLQSYYDDPHRVYL